MKQRISDNKHLQQFHTYACSCKLERFSTAYEEGRLCIQHNNNGYT